MSHHQFQMVTDQESTSFLTSRVLGVPIVQENNASFSRMVTDESIKTKRSPLDNFLRPFDLPTLYFTVQKFICVRTPPPNLTNLSSNKIGGLSCLYSRNGLYPCCIMIPNLFNNTVS